MSYAHPQARQDAFEWEGWFADHRLFRDCRFDNGRWLGPARLVRSINAKLPLDDPDE